ncbi:hypothetical protein [Desulfolithobacter sp.]
MQQRQDDSRRSFLKSLLAGSAVAAGVVTASRPARATRTSGRRQVQDEVLYRETSAFKDYYKTLRS